MATKKKAVKKEAKVAKAPKKEGVAVLDETTATPEDKIREISREVSKVEESAAAMVVNNEDDRKLASEFLLGIKGRLNRINELRLFFVKPLKDQAKKIDQMFGDQAAPLEAIEARVKRAISNYVLEEERKARAEEDRLRKLREKQDVRREEKGLAPVATPLPTIARPNTVARVEGGKTITVKVWKFEVLNIDAVPRNLLRCEVAHSKVQAQIDAGARHIDGLRIYEDVEVRANAR